MTVAVRVVILLTVALLVAAIFALYQNPLLEIYLSDWALC